MTKNESSRILIIVEKFARGMNPNLDGFSERTERYVSDLLYAKYHWEACFAVSQHVVDLQELEAALLRAKVILDRLGKPLFYEADSREFADQQLENFNLSEFSNELQRSVQFIKAFRNEPDLEILASPKRNWVAASVAETCKYIWGEEKALQIHGTLALHIVPPEQENQGVQTNDWDDYEKLENYLLSLSPHTQNHLRPGPFGRFVEEVFECLSIRDKVGNVVSASTALDSLRTLKCPENIII